MHYVLRIDSPRDRAKRTLCVHNLETDASLSPVRNTRDPGFQSSDEPIHADRPRLWRQWAHQVPLHFCRHEEEKSWI